MRNLSLRRGLFIFLIGLLALCVLLAGISALLNRNLPDHSSSIDQPDDAQKAHLEEFVQVRRQLGNRVWPGWDTAKIPIVLYNEGYAFLVGLENPAEGWWDAAMEDHHGGPWQVVANDTFAGAPYYRQPLPEDGTNPQAFTVRIGQQWAASMPTKEWMEIRLTNQFRQDLPEFFAPVAPYSFLNDLFLRGSEGYISLLAHESFHAYQGIVVPERLVRAETNVAQAERQYPWTEDTFQQAWQAELDILTDGLRASSDEERAGYARQFLQQRASRRGQANLGEQLVDYEKNREWLEGLARYVELELWRQASMAEDYTPNPDLQGDPDFSTYETFSDRWSQEIDQIGRMAGDEGDGRFYYSGMAQAKLLDWLMPGWKGRILEDGVYLEDLLEEAISNFATE